jgi:hypothetical protein
MTQVWNCAERTGTPKAQEFTSHHNASLVLRSPAPAHLCSGGNWPNTFVEPANLTVHIAALRRFLGDGRASNRFLINIPGRGYRFVAPIKVAEQIMPGSPGSIAVEEMHNLPAHVTRVSGDAGALAELTSQLSRDHFLTIAGSDGNGRASVASAVAEELIANYKHGIWLIGTFLRQAS